MGWCIRAPPRRRSGVRGIQSGALDGFGLSETAARAADRTNCSPELPTPACGCAAASARRRALGSRRAVGAARMSGTARWSDREPRRPSLRPGRLARLGEVAPARRTALEVCRPPPVLARAGTGARGATSPCCPASLLGALDRCLQRASVPPTRAPCSCTVLAGGGAAGTRLAARPRSLLCPSLPPSPPPPGLPRPPPSACPRSARLPLTLHPCLCT
jgi:hypothetical protein